MFLPLFCFFHSAIVRLTHTLSLDTTEYSYCKIPAQLDRCLSLTECYVGPLCPHPCPWSCPCCGAAISDGGNCCTCGGNQIAMDCVHSSHQQQASASCPCSLSSVMPAGLPGWHSCLSTSSAACLHPLVIRGDVLSFKNLRQPTYAVTRLPWGQQCACDYHALGAPTVHVLWACAHTCRSPICHC